MTPDFIDPELGPDCIRCGRVTEKGRGVYLERLYSEQWFCTSCGRRERFCTCEDLHPWGHRYPDTFHGALDELAIGEVGHSGAPRTPMTVERLAAMGLAG